MTRRLLEKHGHKAGAATGVRSGSFANNARRLKDWDIDTSEEAERVSAQTHDAKRCPVFPVATACTTERTA